MMRTQTILATAAVLAALLSGASIQAQDFVGDVKQSTQALCRGESRLLGSEGHEKAKNYLVQEIEALSGVTLVRQTFPVNVPVTERAELTVGEGALAGTHRIFPVWPDMARLKTTPEAGISGKPVYIGDGDYDALPTKSLRGNIAVLEMSAYKNKNWLRAFEFGASAILLLGSDDDVAEAPLYKGTYHPRYYVPKGPLADTLRASKLGQVTIHCDAQWREERGENLIALVPGTDPSLEPIILAAQYDAMSVVQGLAPGADSAVDSAFLLRTLKHMNQLPPRRGAAVVFVDAFGFNMLGVREFLAMLTIVPEDATRQAYEKQFQKQIDEYEEVVEQVRELGEDPRKALSQLADKKQYPLLQRYAKDALSPELVAVRERLFDLRVAEGHATGEKKEAITKAKEEELAYKTQLTSILSGVLKKGKLPDGLYEESAAMWREIRERTIGQLAMVKERSRLFDTYDATRAKVFAAMGLQDPPDIAFPFIFGVDLSDSGINVGPSYHCGVMVTDYTKSASQFVDWLKRILKDSDNPYAALPRERLSALGLRADGLQALVGQILNSEAIQSPDLAEEVMETIPGISREESIRLLATIRGVRDADVSNVEDEALVAMMDAVPDLEQRQAEELVIRYVNRDVITSGGIDPSSTTAANLALITSASTSFQVNGVTWSTLEGIRRRLDTPQDTFERLDWERLGPQVHVTALLVDMMLNDENFDPEPSLVRKGTFPSWRIPEGLLVSETISETIARTPRPDMLATSVNKQFGARLPVVRGVRNFEFVRSGPDGSFRFRPMPADSAWPARRRHLRAYMLDDRGRIVRSVAKIASILSTNDEALYALRQNPPLAPLRGETFECVAVNGPSFRDPRYQVPLTGGKILDVNRGGVPQRHVFRNDYGPMFALLQPQTRYQLILGLGGGKNRMALLNMPEDLIESGKTLQEALKNGYAADKPLPALPQLISARDFYLIDEWRLQRLEGAGITVQAIREIHNETREWLARAEEAYEADDGQAHKRASAISLANEIRVYHAAQAQANDVTNGAIFLLLLLVPFSIALERLLFASPEVSKQIGRAIGIFVVMFGVLVSFHPGFRITSMPAVILIAFLVLLLSVSVINMILKKFRADMEELRRGSLAEASGAQTGRGGVMMSAVWLGIANMRKRFLRTMLTGLTIVLVTFALLCFTSSSTYQQKRATLLEGVEKTHNGVLLQHPTSQPLDNQTEESIRVLVGNDKQVAGRYWVLRADNHKWRLHIRNARTNALAALKTGLGLRANEDEFSNVRAVLTNWERFADGDGCYVSVNTAERLGVKPGDTLVVGGTNLELIDTFEARALEDNLRKLDGQSMLPMDYSIQQDDWALQQGGVLEESMAEGGLIEPDASQIHVSGDEVLIMPVSLAKDFEADLRSVAVRSDQVDAEVLANNLVQNIVYPVYFGAEDGVKALVSTPLLPSAPRKLLVPILIAALIIFNTMLNSIAERKKEIYIYSSLGLSPRHIGVLFLGEALTYGLMGSVFGYVIGQGFATVLTHFNLMGGITLNYSGSNVILTMGLVLLVVALSSIIPALMAAKIASPSGDLDWKVPTPKDGVIRGLLPFTVSEQAAPGLAAFVREYLVAHKDGAIGNFIADNIRLEAGQGNSVVQLSATVWPAPYDLGVRQEMILNFEKSEEDICDLRIRLEHGSGPERSWWRLNKVFIGDLRSQLLGWRNIAPQRMFSYVKQSDLHKDAPSPLSETSPAATG